MKEMIAKAMECVGKIVEIIDFFKQFSILSHVHDKKTKNEDIVKFIINSVINC
jgi:hypothetical protein